MLWNFIEITLRFRCSPVNLQHIFRTLFPKNTSGWLLPNKKLSESTKTQNKEVQRRLHSMEIIHGLLWISRSSHWRYSIKQVVLKNFPIFTVTLSKRDSKTSVFLWILRTFNNTYFEEHLWTAASKSTMKLSGELSNIKKFNYPKRFLHGEALCTIDGMTLTDHYCEKYRNLT